MIGPCPACKANVVVVNGLIENHNSALGGTCYRSGTDPSTEMRHEVCCR